MSKFTDRTNSALLVIDVQVGVVGDAFERAWGQLITGLSCNRNPAGLGWVLELTVAAAGCHQGPAIRHQHTNDLPHLHGRDKSDSLF